MAWDDSDVGGSQKPWGFVANRPQPMLGVRLHTGQRKAVAYHDLAGLACDGHTVTLYYYTLTITIEGVHLGPLAELLERQVVRVLIEQHVSPLLADQEEAYIHRITFTGLALEHLWA
jgi:hypothetical protein